MTMSGSKEWKHRRVHNYHEWRWEEQRDFGGKRVYADAVVTAAGGDERAPANWEVLRDGTGAGS